MSASSIFHLLYCFKGRISRLTYVVSTVSVMAFLALALFVVWAIAPADRYDDSALMGMVIAFLCTIFALAIVPAFAITVRRLQDRNKSAAWLLPFWAVPSALDKIADRIPEGDALWWLCVATWFALTVWAFVELVFLNGTEGDNAYGSDPLDVQVSAGVDIATPRPLPAA